MIHVLIDTSALRQVSVTKSVITKALKRLAQGSEITLHVPEVVVKEYSSGQAQEFKKKLRSLQLAFADLRKIPQSIEFENWLHQVSGDTAKQGKKAIVFSQDHLVDWLNASRATVHPISDHHGARVMMDYFDGQPPYKQKKNRADIPDSFIWQVIQDLHGKHDDLIVIVADGEIRTSCESTGIVSFGSLAEFVSSDDLQSLFESPMALENLLKSIAQNQDVISSLLDEAREILALQLVGESITDHRILDDNMEGTVSGVEAISNPTLDLTNLHYLGDGMYSIPFVAKLEGLVDSYIYKADYYCLDETRAAQVSVEDCNDRVFAVQEHFPLQAIGDIEIELQSDRFEPPSLKSSQLRDFLDDMRIQLIEIYGVGIDPNHEVNPRHSGADNH